MNNLIVSLLIMDFPVKQYAIIVIIRGIEHIRHTCTTCLACSMFSGLVFINHVIIPIYRLSVPSETCTVLIRVYRSWNPRNANGTPMPSVPYNSLWLDWEKRCIGITYEYFALRYNYLLLKDSSNWRTTLVFWWLV